MMTVGDVMEIAICFVHRSNKVKSTSHFDWRYRKNLQGNLPVDKKKVVMVSHLCMYFANTSVNSVIV